MKISKVESFQPVTILIETQDELTAMKGIVQYLQSFSEHDGDSYPYSRRYRFEDLPFNGTDIYYKLKSGL